MIVIYHVNWIHMSSFLISFAFISNIRDKLEPNETDIGKIKDRNEYEMKLKSI